LDSTYSSLKGKAKVVKRRVLQAKCLSFSLLINDIYIAGIELLLERLNRVTTEYRNTLDDLQHFKINHINVKIARRRKIKIADRDLKNVIKSRFIAMERFYNLHKFINISIVTGTFTEDFSKGWRTLREMGVVMMEEISYLSQRVDQFQQIIDNRTSIMWAVVTLAITGLIAFLSWRFPVTKDGLKDTQSIKMGAVIRDESESKAVPTPPGKITPGVTSTPAGKGTPTATASPKVPSQFSKLDNAINPLDNPTSAVSDLGSEIMGLRLPVEKISLVNPPETVHVASDIAKMEFTLEEIKESLEKKKPEPSATPEEPEYHGWGVGYIRFRPSKVAHVVH
jgi:hypothetical protein